MEAHKVRGEKLGRFLTWLSACGTWSIKGEREKHLHLGTKRWISIGIKTILNGLRDQLSCQAHLLAAYGSMLENKQLSPWSHQLPFPQKTHLCCVSGHPASQIQKVETVGALSKRKPHPLPKTASIIKAVLIQITAWKSWEPQKARKPAFLQFQRLN